MLCKFSVYKSAHKKTHQIKTDICPTPPRKGYTVQLYIRYRSQPEPAGRGPMGA